MSTAILKSLNIDDEIKQISLYYGMKSMLLGVVTMIFITSCNSDKHDDSRFLHFEEEKIPAKEKMKKALTLEYCRELGYSDSTFHFLHSYYSKRKYQPRWINDSTLTDQGLALKKVLFNSISVGIPKNRSQFILTENFIQDELNLTVTLAQTAHDIQEGFIDYELKKYKPLRFSHPDSLDQRIKFSNTTEIRNYFIQLGPNDSTYIVIAKKLIEMSGVTPIDTTSFSIPTDKDDSLMRREKTELALFSKGYLKNTGNGHSGIDFALKEFQKDNGLTPDGIVGKNTIIALNESSYHKMLRMLLAMDKIRARGKFPSKYIHINIPEYKLRFYVNDSLKSEHNIIVGTPKNPTPELTSALKRIIIYPFWNVPYSISSKEILPVLRNNPSYLNRNNFKIYRNNVEINPHWVNWKEIRPSAFPYRIVQQPGPGNSLGIVKFDFDNPHSVYIHDTPSKPLFSTYLRAYSHGCIRTEHPIHLARTILANDTSRNIINPAAGDSLDSIISRGTTYTIRLLKTIPLFVEYITASRDKDRFILFSDIYVKDLEYVRIMTE